MIIRLFIQYMYVRIASIQWSMHFVMRRSINVDI